MSSENYAESRHPTNLVIDPPQRPVRQDRVPGAVVDRDELSASRGVQVQFEATGLGLEGEDAKDADCRDAVADALRHLRALRTEKAVLRDVGGPLEKLDQLKDEVDKVEADVKKLYEGRTGTLKLCLTSESMTAEERERLEKLVALENKDLMMLDGLDLHECCQAVKAKLQSLENEEGVKLLMNVVDRNGYSEVYTSKKLEMLKAHLKPPSPRISLPPVQKKDIAMLSDIATRFASLDDRLQQLESVVGMDVVEAMSFPFQDIPTAICLLTERMLLLDSRKLDAIHDRATELSKELDKLLSTKAHFVYGGDGPSLQALTSEKKIETLYQLATRWKATANSLPRLVQKLKYLSILTRDTSEIESRLTTLEGEVADTKKLMESCEKSLAALNATASEHIELMTKLATRLESSKIFD